MRDRQIVTLGLGLALAALPAPGLASETVSQEDLQRRLADGKAQVESFQDAFTVGGQRDARTYYRELPESTRAWFELARSEAERPPRVLNENTAPELLERFRSATAEAERFAAAGTERARDANDAARRFVREAEMLRGVAPAAPIPAVNVGFRFRLGEAREALGRALSEVEREATTARFLWSKEFGQLKSHLMTFRTKPLLSNDAPGGELVLADTVLVALVNEYMDAFLAAEHSPEGPLAYLGGNRAWDLWRYPTAPLALFRTHQRWLNSRIQERRLEGLRRHREALDRVLGRLDEGLGRAGWETLAHPPRPEPRRVTVKGLIVAARPLPPESERPRFRILVEDRTLDSEDVFWGPVEVDAATGRPAVSAQVEYRGQTLLPSEIKIEEESGGVFFATIRYDPSALAPGVWAIAGRVVERGSGKPVAGAQVGVRDASVSTTANGLFGPVEVPAEVASVAIQVSVSRHGKVAGAAAGATRPESGRAFVEIAVDLPAPPPQKPTLSLGAAVLDPQKPSHDVGEPVRFTLAYEVQGLGEGDRVSLERKFRIRGGAVVFPEGGGWVVDRVQAGPGSGTFSGGFTIGPRFGPGRHVLDLVITGEGLAAPPPAGLALTVSDLHARLTARLEVATGLIEQCKPLDAEPLLGEAIQQVGERSDPPWSDLRARLAAALDRARLAAGWWADTMRQLSLARGALAGCNAKGCQAAIDQAAFPPALPAACAMALRPPLLQLYAEAQERLDAEARMQERITAGEQAMKACRFQAAAAAFGDPAFAGASACQAEQGLAGKASQLAEAARKLEALGDIFQERLKAGRTALAAGRRAEAEAAARKVIESAGQSPVPACFAEERQLAQVILGQATGASGPVPAFLTQGGAPPPPAPGNLVAQAERRLREEAEAEREKERRAREEARQAAERRKAEQEHLERERAERERLERARAEQERLARSRAGSGRQPDERERPATADVRRPPEPAGPSPLEAFTQALGRQVEAARRERPGREEPPSFDGLERTPGPRPSGRSASDPVAVRPTSAPPGGDEARRQRERELNEQGRRLGIQAEVARRSHTVEDLLARNKRIWEDINNLNARNSKLLEANIALGSRIQCLKEGRIAHPRTQADCRGKWIMRTHATEIAELEGFIQSNRREIEQNNARKSQLMRETDANVKRIEDLRREIGDLRARL